MVRVIWAREAIDDLMRIEAYVAQFNPAAANHLAGRLFALGNGLEDFPERGRPSSRGRRELPGLPPYILRYRYVGLDETVVIERIRHGRRRPL
jgi:plasmid stabilization system protein ParE